MTLSGYIPCLCRLLRRLLSAFALVVLWASQGMAAELRVSEVPIQDILPIILENDNASMPPVEDATYDIFLVNDTDETVVLRFRTEMITPLAFFFSLGDDKIFDGPFAAGPQQTHASQGPVNLSDPLVLAPGQRLALRAQFEHPPGKDLFPISLITEETSDRIERWNRTTHGLYFGAMVAFVLLFLVSSGITSSGAARWFGVYLLALTVLNAHAHGYLIDVFDLPPSQYFAVTRSLHFAIVLAYLMFAMSFLGARQRYPRLWTLVAVFLAVLAVLTPLEIFLWHDLMRSGADALALVFLLIGIACAFLALRDRHHGGGFFAAGFGLLLVVGVVNYIGSVSGFAAWNDMLDRVTLALQFSDAIVFGGAVFRQVFSLRQERDAAVQGKLAEARSKLALSEKLRHSETNLHRARNLAEHHRATMAATSHDLRQPIASLRVALERARKESPGMASELSSGIEFLDSVLSESLANSRPDAEDAPASALPANAEPVALQMVFDNVQRMFNAEAERKGVTLKIVPSSETVAVRVLDLVRILSNLTANAIRYTDNGGVLVGARRRNGAVALEVWDTGCGIPADQLDLAMQPYQRGVSDNTGEGLGLAIVNQLAEANGLSVTISSQPGSGTVVRIGGLQRADGTQLDRSP